MAKSDDDEVELPFVVSVDVGQLPDEGVAIQIIYATSAERFAAKKMDTMVFAMTRARASEFARKLLRQTDPGAAPPKGPTVN